MAVQKYRPKAVVVDAEQFDGTFASAERIAQFGKQKAEARAGETFETVIDGETQYIARGTLVLHTTAGAIEAHPTDWVLKDRDGDVRVLRDAEFQAHYEKAK